MFWKLLRIDDVSRVHQVEPAFRMDWPPAVLPAAILCAVAFTVYLYRRGPVPSRPWRVFLGILRALVLVAVVTLLFEPVLGITSSVKVPRTVLALLDVSDSMNIKDPRRQPGDLKAAAVVLGEIDREQVDRSLPDTVAARVADVPRIDLAKALFLNNAGNVFNDIDRDYRLRCFTFGHSVKPEAADMPSDESEADRALFSEAQAGESATRLGDAVEEVVSRFAGQSLSGVVVLSDGASNEGLDPLEAARRMQERAVPLYPVGIGLSDPPDIRLDAVMVPDTVFVKDRVPVRLQFSSTGFAGRRATVVLTFRGRPVGSEVVVLSDEAQFLEMTFVPAIQDDSAEFSVEIKPAGLGETEAGTANNRVDRTMRVIDEKIRVLYVEGKPRWEYRYLRRVLLRDHRLDVKFWMTEGDRELAKHSDSYLATFPMAPGQAFEYDLIIVGDVPRKTFTPLQMQRMEELVRDHGGAFLMLAGLYYAPVEYVNTPIGDMLPVRVRPDGWRSLNDMVHPVVTPEGSSSAVALLTYPEDRNSALWYGVKPLFAVARLDGAKSGATSLLSLSGAARGGEPYPLVCWHRHRRGKVMYVGSDQLWRLRLKRGDRFHTRFWGQTIQFLTLSRLLSGNKRVQLEADRPACRVGERIYLSANVLDEAYSPHLAKAFTVSLERQDERKETTPLRLEATPGIPGLYRGFYSPEQEGSYELHAKGVDKSDYNVVVLHVEAASREQLQPAMQEDTLREMARLSGGRYFDITTLPKLTEELKGEPHMTNVRYTRELFDQPVVFVLLLLLLSVEWFTRRRSDLV